MIKKKPDFWETTSERFARLQKEGVPLVPNQEVLDRVARTQKEYRERKGLIK